MYRPAAVLTCGIEPLYLPAVFTADKMRATAIFTH